MAILNVMNKLLSSEIQFLELFIYLVCSTIIFISIIYSIYYYFLHITNDDKSIWKIKIFLSNSISLVLSFILTIEILKFYQIRSYKQLIIIASLVFIKMVIGYFLMMEINDTYKHLKNI